MKTCFINTFYYENWCLSFCMHVLYDVDITTGKFVISKTV